MHYLDLQGVQCFKKCTKNLFVLQHMGHKPWKGFVFTFDSTSTLLSNVHGANPHGNDDMSVCVDMLAYFDMSWNLSKEYSI